MANQKAEREGSGVSEADPLLTRYLELRRLVSEFLHTHHFVQRLMRESWTDADGHAAAYRKGGIPWAVIQRLERFMDEIDPVITLHGLE